MNPYEVTIEVNGVQDTANTVQLSGLTLNAVGISPNSVSPVLKQDLSITFESSFPDIDKEDYSVFIRPAVAGEGEF